MSDTPRTDAYEKHVANSWRALPISDFARQLERENAALREKLNHTVTTKYHDEIVQEAINERVKETTKLERENATLREDKERLDWLEHFLRLGDSSVSCCVGGTLKDSDFVYENEKLAGIFSGYYSVGYQVEIEDRGCYRWNELGGQQNRLRAALDAARKDAK